MTTKRGFLGLVGAALLLVFGMPSWAVAQTELPMAAAILSDNNTDSDGGTEMTGVTATMVDPMYSSAKVMWTIADGYRANCGAGTGETGTACAANETPLTGFRVYYSSQRSDFTTANAEGTKDVSAPGRTAADTAAGSATVEDLTPGTTYYFRVAARNSVGVGAQAVQGTVASVMTAAAPLPEQVARVEVESGPMKLDVSWDAPRPDKDANRTNLTIAMYHVQYRTSQTVENQPGDWMPTPMPMEVPGRMTTTEITGLTDGMSYDVQVRAVNDATGVGEWSAQSSTTTGTPGGAMPTPALPLVGAFGLGFGLLAAGRARLRRRAQLQLTTR